MERRAGSDPILALRSFLRQRSELRNTASFRQQYPLLKTHFIYLRRQIAAIQEKQ